MQIFSGLYGRGPVQRELTDAAFVQAMLDVEVALARALVDTGLASDAAGREIAASAPRRTLSTSRRSAPRTADYGTPVPGLLAAIRARLSDDAATTLHRGATSQDIVDTAMMLVVRRALPARCSTSWSGAQALCAELADAHRGTVMAGRTLLQQAEPITFGLKSAVWLNGLTEARHGLLIASEQAAVVQLGGAAGTLAAYGERGPDLVRAFAGSPRPRETPDCPGTSFGSARPP